MAKNKSLGASHYELLFLLSNEYTEEEIKPIAQKVKGVIEEKGGKITHSEDWGKQRLAYPVRHFAYGYYFLYEFDAEGGSLANIDKVLRLDKQIMRHQIVVKRPKTEEEIKTEIKRTEKKEEKIAAEKKMEKEKEKGHVDLKDLDEKLDKILETDDLL
jgi:small subunit ribosomal protein S6